MEFRYGLSPFYFAYVEYTRPGDRLAFHHEPGNGDRLAGDGAANVVPRRPLSHGRNHEGVV